MQHTLVVLYILIVKRLLLKALKTVKLQSATLQLKIVSVQMFTEEPYVRQDQQSPICILLIPLLKITSLMVLEERFIGMVQETLIQNVLSMAVPLREI